MQPVVGWTLYFLLLLLSALPDESATRRSSEQ